MTKENTSRIVLYHDDTTNFGGLAGKHYLATYQANGAGEVSLPIVFYDITAMPNTDYNGNNWAAQFGYRPVLTDGTAAGGLTWYSVGSSLNQQVTPQAGEPNKSSVLRAIKARMMFYCPTKIPTRISVRLVQFKDQRLQPVVPDDGTVSELNNHVADNTAIPMTLHPSTIHASQFYRDYVQTLSYNPVKTRNAAVMKQFNILKTWSFVLNPKDDTEVGNTRYHELNIYHKFFRACHYNWQQTDGAHTLATSYLDVSNANNRCCVDPKARIYLMIEGVSIYHTALDPGDDGADYGGSPSYDISFKAYHDTTLV